MSIHVTKSWWLKIITLMVAGLMPNMISFHISSMIVDNLHLLSHQYQTTPNGFYFSFLWINRNLVSNSLCYRHHLLSKAKNCFKKGQKVIKSRDGKPINSASLLTVSLPVPLELSEAEWEEKFFQQARKSCQEGKPIEVPRLSLSGHVQIEALLS